MEKKYVLLMLCFFLSICQVASAAELNLYSARKENLIGPMLAQFTAKTGITVNLVTGKADALLQQIKNEGQNSPADMLLTSDVGRLYRAVQDNIFQPVTSDVITRVVPPSYRDSKGYWVGLSLRSRVFVYSKKKVKPADLSTYLDLANPKWKGRICVRSSNNIYNQSLVAAMVANFGEEAVQHWANGFVQNFARKPTGGDRDQIKAVAKGVCDIAVINTYYLGKMTRTTDHRTRAVAAKVGLFWPDQNGNGAHVNVSGAGVVKSAKNKTEAIALIDFLLNERSQHWYADVNHEYPVRKGIEWSKLLQSFGTFKPDGMSLGKLGENNAKAVQIMAIAGWE